MLKATKNNETFEVLNTTTGTCWIATHDEIEVRINATECGHYLATLWIYDRPKIHVEGENAQWALTQLAKECKSIVWDDTDFYQCEVFPLCKNFNDFMKRPIRETYNIR